MVYCEYVGIGDPTAEPPKVHWTGEKYQKASQKDALDKLVANAAGDPFVSGLARDHHRSILIIERNVFNWDQNWPSIYLDTLNQFPILTDRFPPDGLAAESCKIDELNAEPVYYPDYPLRTEIQYWRQTIKISIDPAGFVEEVLNAGFNQLVDVSVTILGVTTTVQERVKIIDKMGGHPSTPQLLDGSGKKLAVGADPVWLPFTKYVTEDWEELNIFF
jgi:hypothetical protein